MAVNEELRISGTMDEAEAKEKLQFAINLLHEIYSAIEKVTIGEELRASGPFAEVLSIYRQTNGMAKVIDLASSDTPF